MNNTTPGILILGIEGMVGHMLFRYLAERFPGQVFGTTKSRGSKQPNVFFLDAKTITRDFANIKKTVPHITYIINCIGILRNTANEKTARLVNAVFPQELALITSGSNMHLVHISTDAVFPDTARTVTEGTKPDPTDSYGKSKLAGEVDAPHVINIRTSVIGIYSKQHRGLLAWALQQTTTDIIGFTNQQWTGCTTIQFAIFCEQIIKQQLFLWIREKTSVFHFAPIAPVSKYQLLLDFFTILHRNVTVKKGQGTPITRILQTKYPEILEKFSFVTIPISALQELLSFEKIPL